VQKLLGNLQNKAANPGVNDDSFTNLQAAEEPARIDGNDPKISMIQSAEEAESFF
jgi:hypothetical protein